MKNKKIGLCITFDSKILETYLKTKYKVFEYKKINHSDGLRILMMSNSKSEMKIWLDLYGFKIGKLLNGTDYFIKGGFKEYIGRTYELIDK